MDQPIEGVPGRLWRLLTLPVRAIAPLVALGRRAVEGSYWVDVEEERPGDGPSVAMVARDDIQRPRDGAGPLNHRRYEIVIADARLGPEELIEAFRHRPNDFSPTSFATFDPPPGPSGMQVGDEMTVRLPGPWDGPVVVAAVEPTRVRLETLDGHMEAGRIEFSAHHGGEDLVFRIESVARSGDAAFDALYHPARVGRLVQSEMWVQVLESAAQASDGSPVGRPMIRTISYPDADT